MSRPRIGLLHYSCPPVIGGVETILFEHAIRLHARGYPVRVIVGRGGPLPDGIALEKIPAIDSLQRGATPAEILAGLEGPLRDLDVLVAHNALTLHFNLALTAALWSVADRGRPRVVSWVHDLSWTNPLYRPLMRDAEPYTFLRRHHPGITTVCVSRQRLSEWLEISGAPASSARVIPNGIDPAALLRLGPVTRGLAAELRLFEVDAVLLAPVRITRRKNLEWALESTAALRDQGRTVRLVVTGPPGPHDAHAMGYVDELRARRRRLSLEQEVCFLFERAAGEAGGYPVDAAALRDLYMLSDVVVLPSLSEGFGLPLAEAALFRTPVVCTDLPAFREVGGDSVRYVRPADGVPAFTAAIAQTLTDAPQRLRRRVLAQLSWDRILSGEIEPLLQSLS
ncbi:MAG TPA: glycosyltransferase family 4 protein [Candidatus Limnocylindrales bacterium]|nr:glycosyltransferase family 4 protein [Candidatus Limnocylindrales bacterium]